MNPQILRRADGALALVVLFLVFLLLARLVKLTFF